MELFMIQLLSSLVTFSHSESMAEAADKLRVSQSALSKRISTLEHQLGYALVQHEGRKAKLTPRALSLLDEVEPLIARLIDTLNQQTEPVQHTLTIAFADAIMVSWGAKLLVKLQHEFPTISFEVHSHRTGIVIERLKRGQYQLGICTGAVSQTESLIVQPLVHEPMAIVVSKHHLDQWQKWRNGESELSIICIEKSSSMWRWLESKLPQWKLTPTMQMESSVGAARLAVEGFGHALVPEGVAKIIAPIDSWFRVDSSLRARAPRKTLTRPCSLISRKTVLNDTKLRPVFKFIEQEISTILQG
jgi:DNA-binding transcriptional LysR family regulator